MKDLIENEGIEIAFDEVDVVTTGTMGAMCSSGAIVNLGHSDPPIKIRDAWINDVPVCHPGAAVDLYIGAAMMSETQPFRYGGGHVIEDLLAGEQVELRARSYGTDCYPRTSLRTTLTKDDLNQFILLNFRNAYQRYACAVNGRDETIYTYMGKLLPHYRNGHYSGSGELNPLTNDPDYETLGLGTKIFLGGGRGYIIGEGTQHSPGNRYGNIMVKGDAKHMNPEYIRGASFTKYGTSIYIGLGVPIPILNMEIVEKVRIRDEDVETEVIDYGVPKRDRPSLSKTNYKELKSGNIELGERKVKVSSMSSLKKAYEICEKLKEWIEKGVFTLTEPIEQLPSDIVFKPMKVSTENRYVGDILHRGVTCTEDADVEDIARRLIDEQVNHIIVIDADSRLRGIITSWDVTGYVASGRERLAELITREVHTTTVDEPIGTASRRMADKNVSALPVLDDDGKVLGIVTSEDIAKIIGGGFYG